MKKEYKEVSYQEKMDFLVNAVKEDANVPISTYPGHYEDGSAIAYFWIYSSTIARKCARKEKLTEKELYIIMSHAIIDELRGKKTAMSRKEKIDYIYNLVSQDPSISISKCHLNFRDGTQVAGFWNTIQTDIRKNKEKNLTKEENYIYYTSACIEDLKRQESLQTLISKFEEFYAYIIQDKKNSVYNKKKQFPDGTYYIHFWNWLQVYIQKCLNQKTLTEQDFIMLYYGAKLDEVLESRQNNYLSTLEKAHILLECVKSHSLDNISWMYKKFSDGTDFYVFYYNLQRFYKSRKSKTSLSAKEQEIINIYLEIRKIRKQAKLESQASHVRKLIQ